MAAAPGSHLATITPTVDDGTASTTVTCVTSYRRKSSMAQLRWQKTADGSDRLAIGQIRWQRTVAAHPSTRVTPLI